MPAIRLETLIQAPITRCFDLARSIDLHLDSTENTNEQTVGGVVSGLIGPNEEVTFRAKHFGVWQELTSKITEFDPPLHFRDVMVSGAFKRFHHDHSFEQHGENTTLMKDVFDFDSPIGVLGKLANHVFLTRYMKRFLTDRNALIQRVTESDEWKKYLA